MGSSQPGIHVLTVTERDAIVFLSLDFDAAPDLRDVVMGIVQRLLHNGEAIGPIQTSAHPGQTDLMVQFLQPLRDNMSLASLHGFLKAVSAQCGFTLLPRTVVRMEDMDAMNLAENMAFLEQFRKPPPRTDD